MNFQKKLYLCFVFCNVLTFCLVNLPARGEESQTLRIGGTGSALTTMRLLGDAFTSQNINISVKILPPIGTQGGIIALQEGALDLALVAQPVKFHEQQQSDFVYRPYAKTAVVIAAEPECAIDSLSEQEISDIFRGNTRSWPNGQHIRLVMRSLNESDFLPVADFSPTLKEALTVASLRKDLVFSTTTQENAHMLSTLPGSLGITSIAQISSEHLSLKTFAYNGIQPTVANVQEGKYPFSKTFALIYAKGRISAPLQRFIEYIYSVNGCDIMKNNGQICIDSH
jgi:phosphate transport system substrate-binding protein